MQENPGIKYLMNVLASEMRVLTLFRGPSPSALFSVAAPRLLQWKALVWEPEQQWTCRMKFKAPTSCARWSERLWPVKRSQKGGKGIGTNSLFRCAGMCHQPWSGLPAAGHSWPLESHCLGEAALSQDRTQLLFRCQGLVNNWVWQSTRMLTVWKTVCL